MKRGFDNRWLGLVSILLLTGCGVLSTPTPYPTYTPYPTPTPRPTYTPCPTYTPYPTYTPQPILGLLLSKYEGTGVAVRYPTGWNIVPMEAIEPEVEGLYIWEPSFCTEIRIILWEWDWEVSPAAEDRYREERENAYCQLIEDYGNRPEFEMLHEYRLGDAPVFEYQYRDEEEDCLWNVQALSYIDPESRQWVSAEWNLWGGCSAEEWDHWMDFRGALFDMVMESIALE